MNIIIGMIAFVSEYLDSGLGMGYGTVLAPILIILGYEPLRVVPAILISQLFTDVAACVFHHNLYNVDLRPGSKDFKAALILGTVSSVGAIISVIIASKVPKRVLALYIGLLVLVMGILVLATVKRNFKFSWRKIIAVSFLASFNKGMSGGGYGPLVMGGQILSGVNVKSAVGITAFAEAMTCLVGFACYVMIGRALDWRLIWMLVIWAGIAVPFAALTVKIVRMEKLKGYAGFLMMLLGLLTVLKITAGG
ncbi:MAG: sulfite exporter TauE/SafE family protein [Candidatus Omnitrophica bacterium]|nr:sulfite exporter TauE/SafE family protein [Candidatus Omnitrophota bacterium]